MQLSDVLLISASAIAVCLTGTLWIATTRKIRTDEHRVVRVWGPEGGADRSTG